MKALIVDYSGKKIPQEKLDGLIKKEQISDTTILMKEPKNDWYATSTFKDVFFFDPSIRGLINLLGRRKSFREYGFEKGYVVQAHHDYETMPVNAAISLFMIGFFLKSSGMKTVHYLDNNLNDSTLKYHKLLASILLLGIKILFAPFIMIIKSPWTYYNILKDFLLVKEDGQDELIGYGPYKKFSGHVYFKFRMKMINRVGTFGIMTNDYLGVPISLHRSPLDGYIPAKIGYRGYLVFSVILMSLAYSWIILESGAYELFILLPLIFTSTFFIKIIFNGHLESIAWSFFCLSVVSFVYGYIWLAALFLGLVVLTHIGIALLNTVVILVFYCYNLLTNLTLPNLYSIIIDLLIFASIVLAMTFYIIIPFLRSREKFGRNKLINEYYEWCGRWNIINGVQAIMYGVFILLAFYLIPVSQLHFMMLIPLGALCINTKLKWLWSAYTMELCMLTTGSIFILLNPNCFLILMYLIIIFSSPALSLRGYHGVTATGIHIEPIRLGKIRTKIIDLFSAVPANARVAFEGGPMNKTRVIYDYNSHLALMLMDEKFEMMNAYGPEIVDAAIFTEMVIHLSHGSSKDILEKALKAGGAGYILAYDPFFKANLRKFGFMEMGSADCTEWTQFGEPGPILTLFKAPFKTSIIEPSVDLQKQPNEISFIAKAGTTYLLRYGYYLGWKAYQNGEEIPIEDAHVGMKIMAPKDGTVTLSYRFRNFFT